MSLERLTKLEKKIMDICVFLHTEISSMNDKTDESMMDLSDVLQLDSFESLENISDTIKDLLRIKRDFQMSEDYNHYRSHEQYQKALQKLEGEVRNHIKIEQQMKLHIESTQAKLDEMEKERKDSESSSRIIDKLKRDNCRLSEKLKEQESLRSSEGASTEREMCITDRGERARFVQEIAMLRTANKKDSQKIADLEKTNKRLELELAKNKQYLEERDKEFSSAEQKYKKLRESISQKENYPDTLTELYKRKYERKCEEIRVLEKRLSQTKEKTRENSREPKVREKTKSPAPKRSDSAARIHRPESPFLSTTRSQSKLREGSIDTKKRPTSSTHQNCYYLSTSRR
ncbi:unnamed protein product [Blepharisma stoltei]|uniref:Uncharacterized protein n=1 Tax=Blepharisma stoltei TaxID=1481888 RepID=A0AAU9JLI1_9CILI|nr:unnamed protein product [Blepharisma stoltei]